MLHILAVTIFLFFSIFLGFIFGKLKIFQPEASIILTRFVFYIALPASLFLSCYKAKISLFNIKYLSSYICTEIITIIFYFLISRIYLKEKLNVSFLNAMSVTQVDGAYFTIPLLVLLFGSAVSIIPLMFIQNVIFFTLFVLCIEVFQSDQSQKNKSILYFILERINRVLFKNPIILSSILGFLLSAFKVKIPEELIELFRFFGAASSPVALFSLGLSFSANFTVAFKLENEKKSIIMLTFGKVLVLPFFAWIVAMLFKIPQEFFLPLILLCASPAATHTFIIAQQYKLNEKIQTNIVVLSTILSFFTINILLYYLR